MSRAALLLPLALLAGCAGDSAAPPPAPAPAPAAVEQEGPVAWSIVHNASSETDHGDGVIRASQSVETHVSPAGAYRITSGWGEGDDPEHPPPPVRTDLPPLDPERLAGIEALLGELEKLADTGDPAFGLRYSLSPDVDDEGGHWEGLTVTIGERTFSIALEQGRQAPTPPPAVARLYELVTGGPTPPHWR